MRFVMTVSEWVKCEFALNPKHSMICEFFFKIILKHLYNKTNTIIYVYIYISDETVYI